MTYEALDTPDHRSLWRELCQLRASDRVRYLSLCCQQASKKGLPVQVTTHSGTTAETYQDLLALDAQYHYSLGEARRLLDSLLRRGLLRRE